MPSQAITSAVLCLCVGNRGNRCRLQSGIQLNLRFTSFKALLNCSNSWVFMLIISTSTASHCTINGIDRRVGRPAVPRPGGSGLLQCGAGSFCDAGSGSLLLLLDTSCSGEVAYSYSDTTELVLMSPRLFISHHIFFKFVFGTIIKISLHVKVVTVVMYIGI